MSALPQVLVPVKSLAAGKSRLAGVLDPAARQALNTELVGRTLRVVTAFAGATRCTVTSPCPQTLAFARRLGVQGLLQQEPGLNAAVAGGVAHLRATGAQALLVVACDLPWLRLQDLHAMVSRGAGRRVVIAADRHGQGTNLLYLPTGAQLRFCYGAGSLGLHFLEAVRAGLDCSVYRSATAGFDVDTPPDLARWRGEALRAA